MVLSAANSDVFEEGGLPDKELANTFGMITLRGIPKPAWRAFQQTFFFHNKYCNFSK